MSRLAVFILMCAALAIASDTPTYEKGTITKKFAAESGSSAQAYYLLEGEKSPYQLKICADFTDGQQVDFRVKGTNVFIRDASGKEIKCSTTAVSSVAKPVTYSKGTIAGYDIRFFPMGNNVRKAKIYDLRGPELIYQIGFCGAFQAGEFTTGQVVDFRLDDQRLYILHDNTKEYSCQLEGTLKLKDYQPAEEGAKSGSASVAPGADVAPTAKLSIASVPDGADIEVDGAFSGNTPSDLEIPAGDHAIAVKKSGYKSWERKLKVVAGSNVHLNAEMEKEANP